MKLEIKYNIVDGYIGHGNLIFIFDTDDLMEEDNWNFLSEIEKTDLINEATQEHFEQNVGFNVTSVKEVK